MREKKRALTAAADAGSADGGERMTLNDILVAALMQLDRGHDAQTLDIWRDKLTRFANDAVTELAGAVKPQRTENVELTGDGFLLSALSRRCEKILAVRENGKRIGFLEELGSGRIRLPHAREKRKSVEVDYRFVPRELSSPTDVPELPEQCHPLIVTYVTGRERASGDPAAQQGANVYFQMFQAGKAALRPHVGGADNYRIVNRW